MTRNAAKLSLVRSEGHRPTYQSLPSSSPALIKQCSFFSFGSSPRIGIAMNSQGSLLSSPDGRTGSAGSSADSVQLMSVGSEGDLCSDASSQDLMSAASEVSEAGSLSAALPPPSAALPPADDSGSDAELLANSISEDDGQSGSESGSSIFEISGEPSAPRPLKDAFKWPQHLLRFLILILGFDAIHGSLLGGKWSVSSHFSGIGTVELALRGFAAACPAHGFFGAAFDFASVCEKAPKNLAILATRVNSSCCIWPSILAFSPVGQTLYERARAVGSLEFWATWQEIRAAGLNRSTAGCRQHARQPMCATPDSHIDVSGSPCQAWSRAAVARLGMRSPDMVLLLVWCLWVLTTKPFVVIFENVKGFPTQLLVQILGEFFEHVVLDVAPRHAGFNFIRRARVYIIFFLRGSVRPIADISAVYKDVSERFAQLGSVPLSECCVATEGELAEEVKQCSLRRGLDGGTAPRSPGWNHLLTAKQQTRLRDLSATWTRKYGTAPHHCQHCVFNLGMNAVRAQTMGGDGAIPTVNLLAGPFLRWGGVICPRSEVRSH